MSPVLIRKIANFVWFQAIWVLTILFQYEWLWLVSLLLVSFFLITDDRIADVLVIGVVAVIGIIVDSALTIAGLFVFDSPTYGIAIPLWLAALWMSFAGTLRHSLRYFMGHWSMCALAGAISGPLSYYGGYKLGAVEFGYPLLNSLATLSVVWALILPLSFWLAMQVEMRREHATI